MFDKHPKGLIAAALANLGERFGFYTMSKDTILFMDIQMFWALILYEIFLWIPIYNNV